MSRRAAPPRSKNRKRRNDDNQRRYKAEVKGDKFPHHSLQTQPVLKRKPGETSSDIALSQYGHGDQRRSVPSADLRATHAGVYTSPSRS
jgi:hypothetical protein